MSSRKIITGLFILLAAGIKAQSFSPAKEALRLFNKYKPTIEKVNHAVVDEPKIVTGDINNDSLEDCLIYFVMTSKDGGNAITGTETAIYLNTGKGMKVVGAFPKFSYCYGVDRIEQQVIYVSEYKCLPPYNEYVKQHKLYYWNETVIEK